MVFAHDTATALRALESLVNTDGEPDELTTLDDLDVFLSQHEYSLARREDEAELEEVRALRPRLRALVTASRDEAAELLNGHLAEARALPQLVRHGGWDWHVHAVSADASVATHILVESAMAVMEVVRGDEMDRLGTCDAEDCDGVVVDLSRNRSRRFCSTACGNRIAVANYRARQR